MVQIKSLHWFLLLYQESFKQEVHLEWFAYTTISVTYCSNDCGKYIQKKDKAVIYISLALPTKIRFGEFTYKQQMHSKWTPDHPIQVWNGPKSSQSSQESQHTALLEFLAPTQIQQLKTYKSKSSSGIMKSVLFCACLELSLILDKEHYSLYVLSGHFLDKGEVSQFGLSSVYSSHVVPPPQSFSFLVSWAMLCPLVGSCQTHPPFFQMLFKSRWGVYCIGIYLTHSKTIQKGQPLPSNPAS